MIDSALRKLSIFALGYLPNKDELSDFNKLLGSYRSLPTSFVRDVILKAPSPDMMNALARSVLMLYSYDENADDISIPNVLRQCLQLIALFHSFRYMAIRHQAIIMMVRALLFMLRTQIFQQQKIFFIC